MKCQPPGDERYRKKYNLKKEAERREKEQKDKIREGRQSKALSSIIERTNFNLVCMLTEVRSSTLHNYQLDHEEQLSFILKGLLRCDMLSTDEGVEWRRLLGTSKKEWKTKNGSLPTAWKSRVYFRLFSNVSKAYRELNKCPLHFWSGAKTCPLIKKLQQVKDNKYGIVLLQIHDVTLDDGQFFSDFLKDFLSKNSTFFKYIDLRNCPVFVSWKEQVTPFESDLTPELIRIKFKIIPLSPLHSGYSTDFAKFAEPERARGKSSVNLELRDKSGNLKPAVSFSSFKGVFRSATAWLFERIAKEFEINDTVSCDYHEKDELEKLCPVCQIYGGPYLEKSDTKKTKHKKSAIRLYGENNYACLYGKILDSNKMNLPFAHELLKGQKGRLKIETLSVNNPTLTVEIANDGQWKAALTSICLSADLLSSGFFRIGRFTSRGFGILRLSPNEVEIGSLKDFMQNNVEKISVSNLCAFSLAQRLIKENPISFIHNWLRQREKG